jgi:ABC-2 type transport system permease protein
MSYGNFWKKNLGFARLGVLTNVEYRLNFLVDAAVQPAMTAVIEVALWIVLFRGIGGETLAGHPKENYLLYALWAAFWGRIASNWIYEHRMIEEIESGSVNAFLARPVTFFEAYWSQYIGYKLAMIAAAIPIVCGVQAACGLGLPPARLFASLALLLLYLFFLHCLSFFVASLAFFFNRVYSLTIAKNFFLWLLSGELLPLDLVPGPWRDVVIALPFSSGVYVPVAYLTGRAGEEALIQGFISTFVGIGVVGFTAKLLWQRGLRVYAGTGA